MYSVKFPFVFILQNSLNFLVNSDWCSNSFFLSHLSLSLRLNIYMLSCLIFSHRSSRMCLLLLFNVFSPLLKLTLLICFQVHFSSDSFQSAVKSIHNLCIFRDYTFCFKVSVVSLQSSLLCWGSQFVHSYVNIFLCVLKYTTISCFKLY